MNINEMKPVSFEKPALGRYHVMIVNPSDGSLVEVADWAKDEDPMRAQLVAIVRNETRDVLLVSKTLSDKGYTFEEAAEVAAAYTGGGAGLAFRLPARREVLDIFDAEIDGFDDAVRLIAGRNDWYNEWGWTGEKPSWFAQRYNVYLAWIFYGAYRSLGTYYVINRYQVGALTLLKLD